MYFLEPAHRPILAALKGVTTLVFAHLNVDHSSLTLAYSQVTISLRDIMWSILLSVTVLFLAPAVTVGETEGAMDSNVVCPISVIALIRS